MKKKTSHRSNLKKASHINPQHLDQQLCFALYSASRRLIQAYDDFLKPLKLTYPQYLVLLVLWQHDQIPVNQIGNELMLDSGTLSPLLKNLETKKIIQKIRQKKDQRVVLVGLTPQGKSLQKKAAFIPREMFCSLSLEEKDFIQLRGQLHTLVKSLASQDRVI